MYKLFIFLLINEKYFNNNVMILTGNGNVMYECFTEQMKNIMTVGAIQDGSKRPGLTPQYSNSPIPLYYARYFVVDFNQLKTNINW